MNPMKCYDIFGNAITNDEAIAGGHWNDDKRRVGLSSTPDGSVIVSTVHLVLDHSWRGEGPPILFETMVFGVGDEEMYRCSTLAEACGMHAEVCSGYKATVQLDSWPEGI